MSKGKTLRASGDFTQAIEGYTAAVRKLSAPLAPGDYPLPPRSISDQVRCLWGQGPATLGRWAVVYRVLEEVHPLEPHWYLGILGTAPAHQGQGLGSALMQPVLDECDEHGILSYLESSKAENIPFYERHGFSVIEEVQIPDGPKLWPMRREAQSR